MTAKIDTQVPERIWITSERSLWPTHRSFTASDLDHSNDDGTSDYPEYERRDLADARAAAAAKAMREAAAGAAYARCGVGYRHEVADAIRALPLPDPAALDRLIAERVREAVEATWGEAIAIVAEYDFERLAHDLIRRMEVARGSKEGQS